MLIKAMGGRVPFQLETRRIDLRLAELGVNVPTMAVVLGSQAKTEEQLNELTLLVRAGYEAGQNGEEMAERVAEALQRSRDEEDERKQLKGESE